VAADLAAAVDADMLVLADSGFTPSICSTPARQPGTEANVPSQHSRSRPIGDHRRPSMRAFWYPFAG
jgi:hypothetical protein